MAPREPEGLTIDLGNRSVRASGTAAVIAVVVLTLVLIASAAPAVVLYRAVVQNGKDFQDGYHRMQSQHDRLIDLQEATVYTFMPPEVQRRMALPKWVRDKVKEAEATPDVRRETLTGERR